MDNIEIRDGIENMDFDAVLAMLRSSSWWDDELPMEKAIAGAENSALVIGAFCGDQQIGYCRAVSDLVKMSYIADVFVLDEYRGCGAAKRMIEHIVGHPKMKDIYRFFLITDSAHGLYEKCGFCATKRPEDWFELIKEENRLGV